jgi:hypothetical protein
MMCSKNCYSHWHKEQGKRTYITCTHPTYTPNPPLNKTETCVVRKNRIVGMAQRTHYIAPRASVELDPNVSTSTILDIKKKLFHTTYMTMRFLNLLLQLWEGGKKNPVRITLPMIPTAINAVAVEAVMLDWMAIYL